MIIDNIIVVIALFFFIYILIKSLGKIREINQSQKKLRRIIEETLIKRT